MTIFQPRLSNISTFEMEREEILDWVENVLKPRALMAYKCEGEYHCGEWCTFAKLAVLVEKGLKAIWLLPKGNSKNHLY